MVKFTKDTIKHFTDVFFKQKFKREFSQTLCEKDGDILPGGELSIGIGSNVKMPRMVCEKGIPVGNIHSHVEPYFDRHPFDKGHSDEDIFLIMQKLFNEEIKTPFIGCVMSPTGDGKGYLNGIDIDCEKINSFTEEELRKIPTGIISDSKEKYFADEEIEFFKKGNPPRGGLFASLGFKVHMANLKGYLLEKGIMERDGFHITIGSKDGKGFMKYETEDTSLF